MSLGLIVVGVLAMLVIVGVAVLVILLASAGRASKDRDAGVPPAGPAGPTPPER